MNKNKTKNIVKKILLWYGKNKRDFPWRHTKDPYRIMIAEFMLHRTRAGQVVPVYENFIKKYPDVYKLSRARSENIKQVTQHLGLHWRSSHFIEAAKYIVKNYNSSFSDTADDLLKIPGIGEYITGAILTVCFNKPYPAVDTNVARFVNRFYGLNLTGEIRRKKEIINIAKQLFNTVNPGKHLFAIIDFTTMICKPRNPDHENCMIKDDCKYFKSATNNK